MRFWDGSLLLSFRDTMISALFGSAAQDSDLVLQNTPDQLQDTHLSDIYDIYGPLPLPNQTNWILYGIAAVIVLLILAALYYLFIQKRTKPAVPPIPPQITALAALAQAREYLTSNQSLLYAERISEILRSYIEQRFNIRSTRQTTSEFLLSMQVEHRNDHIQLLPHQDALKKCMQQCDMAKYAHKKADIETMEEMEKGVRSFIEETMVEEEKN